MSVRSRRIALVAAGGGALLLAAAFAISGEKPADPPREDAAATDCSSCTARHRAMQKARTRLDGGREASTSGEAGAGSPGAR